jgi:hypothetical protein
VNILSVSGLSETGEVLGFRNLMKSTICFRVVFMNKNFGVLEEDKSKTSLQKSRFGV